MTNTKTATKRLMIIALALLLAFSSIAMAISYNNMTTTSVAANECVVIPASCEMLEEKLFAPPPLPSDKDEHFMLNSGIEPKTFDSASVLIHGWIGESAYHPEYTSFNYENSVFSISTTYYTQSHLMQTFTVFRNTYYTFSVYIYSNSTTWLQDYGSVYGVAGVFISIPGSSMRSGIYNFNTLGWQRFDISFNTGNTTQVTISLLHGLNRQDGIGTLKGTTYFNNPSLTMDWYAHNYCPYCAAYKTFCMDNNTLTITTANYNAASFVRTFMLTANTQYRLSMYVYSNATYFAGFSFIGFQTTSMCGQTNRATYYNDNFGGWQRLEMLIVSQNRAEFVVRLLHGFNMGGGVGMVRGTTEFRHITLERLDNQPDNNWRILGVIAREVDTAVMIGGRLQTVRISMSEQDVAIARNSFSRLANSLNTMSNNQMKATVEVIEIFTPITRLERLWHNRVAYGISQFYMHYVISNYIDVDKFDHVSSFVRLAAPGVPTVPMHWAGYFGGTKRGVGYTFTRFSEYADCDWHTNDFFPDHVLVHEVIHDIESLSRIRGIPIPRDTIDNPIPYIGRNFGFRDFEGRKQWYTDVMNQNVWCPNLRQYIGFTLESYLIDRFTLSSVAYSRVSPAIPLRMVRNLRLDNDRTLFWQRVPEAVAYNVYINGRRVNEDPVLETYFSLSEINFSAGQTNIQIRALGRAPVYGASVLSTPLTFTTLYAPMLNIVQNIGLLNWNNIDGANRFYVYMDSSTGSRRLDLDTITMSNFNLNELSLTPGVYYFQVRAVADASDMDSSILSDRARFVVSSVLNAPIIFEFDKNSTLLRWQSTTNNTGFNIYVDGIRVYTATAEATYFDFNRLELSGGTHIISIRTVGDGEVFLDSLLSEPILLVIPYSTINLLVILLAILIPIVVIIITAVVILLILKKRQRVKT